MRTLCLNCLSRPLPITHSPPPSDCFVCVFVCLFVCSELSVDPLDPHSMVKRTFGENGPPVGYDLEDDAPTF